MRKTEFGTLVSISAGSEGGVMVGDAMYLRRGGPQYVGRILIGRVYRNRSVGILDEEYLGDAALAQGGDVASVVR